MIASGHGKLPRVTRGERLARERFRQDAAKGPEGGGTGGRRERGSEAAGATGDAH